MFALSKVVRRSQSLRLGACNAVYYSKLEIPLGLERNGSIDSNALIHDKDEAFSSSYELPWNFTTGRRSLSSDAGARSSGEEDDLESIETSLHSEEELSCDEGDIEGAELELLSEAGKTPGSRRSSELFKAIVSVSGLSVATAIDKWVEEGKEINRTEIANAMLQLRRRRMYGRALQLVEWLEEHKPFELEERDYASRLDLIAKVRGLHKGELYIERIPESFRGELVYRTLLTNYASTSNVRKAEAVFNKMKDLGFPRTSYACDQMLMLYKRVDKKKIAETLLMMEKENLKPTLYTYQILIDAKGASNDISGMEQVVETMKSEGVEVDLRAKSIVARHYASAGLKEKAEKVLKEMEGESLEANRYVCKDLLSVYGFLQRADEVSRIWKICEENNPYYKECLAAILAFGKINKVKEAEAVFEKSIKMSTRVSSGMYSVLLRVYVDHKMVSEGKDLVKRMLDSGCNIGALTWDALIRLYVEAGEVEMADSSLSKATQLKQIKPLMSSFMCVMDEYARRGDVHNTEKIFQRMRQSGYLSRFRQFQSLIQAYVNAKAPAYGMKDRMKADNVFPNRGLAVLLANADPFKKTPLSDLLD
ncbi:Pentatricopeptide repeat-containing protein [Raphanus sativus]|uniref:Pentatricopeptide repeat-containing protein At1g15480, mitochondrial n=1 Tax=Raphanus sativus TaxID=3726 RepID=A0A6J0JIE1_RAPSA|nr:pentatricopeptide repeat-containing protein At1g15480, mitochondrial [Raphanus sativus]XP_018435408.2 pentatricopeptide repeat-containing protein At1g15480, mitochondrial [Raphanus sativus]KAJ4915878.1 Pentatricopeptide repeat-containing protein [Raphanus sativus]